MQYVRKTFCSVTLLLIITSLNSVSVLAAGTSSSLYSDTQCDERPDLYQKAVTAANSGMQAEITQTANNYGKMDQAMKPLSQNGTLNSCLQFKGVSSGSIGLPSYGDVLDKLITTATKTACNAINSAYEGVTQEIGQNVVLPGGIGIGSDIGLPSIDPSFGDFGNQVQTQAQNAITPVLQEAIQATQQGAQNIYDGAFK